jgi:hypothetical protein
LSSLAVPVMVKLVEGRMPLGPVMFVVGVWSSVPNDSNFLVALVESPVPAVAAVKAWAETSMLRLLVTSRLSRCQVRVAPVPASRVALTVVAVLVQVLAEVRNWLLSRSWIDTWTRPTVPEATVADPVTANGALLATTRPSTGVRIVVSGLAAG